MWQPIETAPRDQFLLLCGPSGYTTTPMVVTTGRMCSDYHAGRWIDHANDDLTDWGFKPTHWAPLILPGAKSAPSVPGAKSAPSVPEGWKLVPIEPTVKIRKAMHYAYWKSPQLPYHDGSPELWNAAYAAMLAAAPEAEL